MKSSVNHATLTSLAEHEAGTLSVSTTYLVLSSLARYQQYLKERAPLKQFVSLAAVIGAVAAFGTQVFFYGQMKDIPVIMASFVAVLFLLLRLRLVDELKDLEHDRLFYPDRPVVRGLVSPREVAQAAAWVFLIETLIATTGGIKALSAFALVALYSFLTLREFFIRKWLRRHFTVYVVSHELLVLPVCYYLYSLNGLTSHHVMHPYFYLLTAFIAGHFFVLEVTRKLRPRELDQDSRDTYTARYGIVNSCILSGLLALWVMVTGIFTAATFSGRALGLGYAGLFLLGPFIFSLLTFARRPCLSTSKDVFNWCVGLVVGTSILFILNMGLVL